MVFQLASLVLLPLVSAAALQPRATTLCNQYDSYQSGSYKMYNNLWGEGNLKASGSWQCSTLDSVNGNTVVWHTQYNWPWTVDGIKSYSNIEREVGVDVKLSAITSIPSTWNWSQDNTGVKANVAYDLFTSSDPKKSAENEIMIWLANYNVGPLSFNYDSSGKPVPVASNINIESHRWNLYKGSNSANIVYSFIPTSGTVNSFSGDVNAFLKYLTNHKYFATSQYLTTLQAGTEATSGAATFSTWAYSVTVNS